MYRRFLAVFVLLWIGLFGLLSVSAQDGPAWIAWLYNADTGEIMEINSTSEGDVSNTWSLPLAQAFNAYPYRIAVSPSGEIVAYVVADTSSETPNRQLLVYNTTIGGIVAAYPLPPEAEADTIDIDPDGLIFDEENHLLAYSYVLVDRSANAAEPSWEIVVIDYQLGEVIRKLSRQDDAAQIVEAPLIVPTTVNFEGGLVHFLSVYYAAGGAAEYPAYTWNTATGEVRVNEIYKSPTSDIFSPTGEMITATSDDRFGFTTLDAEGPVPKYNVVEVYDQASHARFPFYHNGDLYIGRAEFIQNGERILVTTYDPNGDEQYMVILGRDGSVYTSLTLSLSIFRMQGTPDGFVYQEPFMGNALIRVRTSDESYSPVIIWGGAPGNITLAHIQNNTPVAETFVDWAQLAEPEIIGE
jgi:hypothetical protein